MQTVTVNGNIYRIGDLDAFDQWDIFCKIGPVIPDFLKAAPALAKILSSEKQSDTPTSGDDAMKTLAEVAPPLLKALSELDRDKSRDVFMICLSVCERQQQIGQHETWAPVVTPDRKTIMFHDLKTSMPAVLGLTFNVIMGNIGSFLSTAQQQPTQVQPQ